MGHILVVDDEDSIRITLKAFLEADGHVVESAGEAESALAILKSSAVDVVLTDIILPKISGVDLLKQIREIAPLVQVIMMTGEPTLETASESLRLGAVDYMQKPVGKTEVLKTVNNALHVKYLSDEKVRLEEENRNHMNALEQLVEKRTRALVESEAALRHRAEELSLLNRLARKVNESITVDDAVQFGLLEISTAAAADLVVLFLRAGSELELKGLVPEDAGGVWQPTEAHRAGVCLCGLAISEDRPVFSMDIRSDNRCTLEECREAGLRSFAALPLRSGSDVLGVLGLASAMERDFQAHASFLEALANEMSIGLKKCLLYEQVQQHAQELQASLIRIKEAEKERLSLQQHLQRSQKMEAIGALASGIAHDFNNILGAVLGYAELALMDIPEESPPKNSVEMVLAAGERAKELVKQILAFSRQSEKERVPVQIAVTVKEVLKFLRASIPTTIEIRPHIGSDLPHIMADPVQIHQVIMNLCTNAHHAMKDRGGLLEVRLTSVNLGQEEATEGINLAPGSYVKLSVEDTGYGMDKATMDKIFDPYFTTKEKDVGTGLGLAVLHGIVQNHGGVVTVTSEPGKGTVFDIYFPAIRKSEEVKKRIPERVSGGSEHILIVDDEQVLVDMGKRMLEHMGYTVETRTSSVEALALFKAEPDRYDLVITDMTMPNMTGDALAAEMMRIRPGIPIVLCTGYSEPFMEERARNIGIRGFVMKPILAAELAKTIREILDNKQEPDEGGKE